VNQLLTFGTKASTGSNEQPWGFLVVQDKEEINELSEKIKEHLLQNMENFPYLAQYKNGCSIPIIVSLIMPPI